MLVGKSVTDHYSIHPRGSILNFPTFGGKIQIWSSPLRANVDLYVIRPYERRRVYSWTKVPHINTQQTTHWDMHLPLLLSPRVDPDSQWRSIAQIRRVDTTHATLDGRISVINSKLVTAFGPPLTRHTNSTSKSFLRLPKMETIRTTTTTTTTYCLVRYEKMTSLLK